MPEDMVYDVANFVLANNELAGAGIWMMLATVACTVLNMFVDTGAADDPKAPTWKRLLAKGIEVVSGAVLKGANSNKPKGKV